MWRPIPLILCNLLALILLVSWYTQTGQAIWQSLDGWVFYKLNGSLAEGYYWQLFWAVTNTKSFDRVSALLILLIYSFYIFSGNREQMIQRTASGLLIFLATILTIQFSKNLLDYGRLGPSISLQPAILLTEVINSFEFKDASTNSFPGDHAIALIMFTSMVWFFSGRSYGLVMLLLSIFLMLPRMVVGAHWLTDNLVGGGYVSLIAVSWLLATPLHQQIIQYFTPLIAKFYALIERLLAFLTGNPITAIRELPHTPSYMLKGFCMGSADIVPGVSGGTMALVLGIYERLLTAIRSVDTAWFKDNEFEADGVLGKFVYLPDFMGYGGALLLIAGFLLIWYLIVVWNEESNKLIVPM